MTASRVLPNSWRLFDLQHVASSAKVLGERGIKADSLHSVTQTWIATLQLAIAIATALAAFAALSGVVLQYRAQVRQAEEAARQRRFSSW